LAQKYNKNLERLIVDVVHNPTTGKLQFSNNIAAAGGIGFFTHSGTKNVDERYLEVILAVPEVFEAATGLSSKVDRLMAGYGTALLGILLSDSAIYNDPEVAGYGLNLFWRNTAQHPGGPQISLERAVLYFKKDQARSFVDQKLGKEAFLSNAVIFAMRGDGSAQQLAYVSPGSASLAQAPIPKDKPAEGPVPGLNPEVRERDLQGGKEIATPPSSGAIREAGAGKNTEVAKATQRDRQIAVDNKAKTPDSSPQTSTKPPAKAERPTAPGPAPESAAPKSASTEAPQISAPAAPQSRSVKAVPEPPVVPPDKTAKPVTVEPAAELALKKQPAPAAAQQQRSGDGSEVVSSKPPPASSAKTQTVPPNQAPSTADQGKKAEIEGRAQVPAPAPSAAKTLPQGASEVTRQKGEIVQEARLRTDPAHGPGKPIIEKSRPSGQSVTRESGEAPATKSESRTVDQTKGTPAKGGAAAKVTLSEDARAVKEQAAQAPNEVRVALKSVEGYVVQFSFTHKNDAHRWSEALSREGYATSITSIGEGDSVRLRVGGFASSDSARDLLGRLEKKGLRGFVIQVPKG
jgi:cell division septation protein DedD